MGGPPLTDLEQLAACIFQMAMDDYDLKLRTAEDPEERAVLAYHRDTAANVARDYAVMEAHKALVGSVPASVH